MIAAKYLGVSYYDVRDWVPHGDRAWAIAAWNADEYGAYEIRRRELGATGGI